MDEGHHLVILLDGNDDMRASATSSALTHLTLQEVLLERHGRQAPSTYRRNSSNTPIDGIWMSPGLSILRGGYLSFDQLFLGTDHRGIWVDVSFVTAFGHTMPPIVKPKARRLTCQDPRLVENFTRHLNKLFLKHNLLEKYPMPTEHQMGIQHFKHTSPFLHERG
jgi:hypothetical protein